MQEIKIPEGCKASIDFEKRVVVIETDILVPESIGIYKWVGYGGYDNGDLLHIGFNNNTQSIGYSSKNGGSCYVVYPVFAYWKKVECKLTPCKREDLKSGDTAFISEAFRLEDSMLSDLGRYVKIIGDKAIKINKKGEPIYDNAFHNHWYKIEPL